MKKNPIKFVFFGTPEFSVHVLAALEHGGFLPALVITAPDKMRGRGLELSPSPAKLWALERDIEVMTPPTLTDTAFAQELQNTEWDVFIVAAYAKRIPKSMLDIPRHGCLNVHPSLLPELRGPSPALSAILENKRNTGVSIMLMEEKMDAGAIIAQARIEIDEAEWPIAGSLFEEMLATEGGNLLAEVLPAWIEGQITPEPQNETHATYTKKFSDADSEIDLSGDALQALLKIRAFDKNPRAHFFAVRAGKKMRVIITDANLVDGKLVINKVIPEGKREMEYQEFLRAGEASRT